MTLSVDHHRARLSALLADAGHGAKKRLADHMGVNPNVVTRMLNTEDGKEHREIKADELDLAYDFFGLSPHGLYRVPVLAWVSASNLREAEGVTERDVKEYIDVGGLPPGDWYAFDVDGDSMDRIAPHGSRILVNRNEVEKVNRANYVVFGEGEQATFKRYLTNPARFQPNSTNPDHVTIYDNENLFVFGRVRRVITDL